MTGAWRIGFGPSALTPAQKYLIEIIPLRPRLCSKITNLQIIGFETDFVPTDETVSVLCDLMVDIIEVLLIRGWELNAGQIQLLESTRRLQNSKVSNCFAVRMKLIR